MLKNLSANWDLDSYFPGGSNSVEFANYLADLQKQITDFQQELAQLETADGSHDTWKHILNETQDIAKKLRHASSFTTCLAAQNTQDKKAVQLVGRMNALNALNANLMTSIEERLLELSETTFNQLLKDEYFVPLTFNLTEIREKASKKLTADKESIINALSVDGYHAWSTLYNSITGSLKIPVEIDGQLKKLSPGQAANMMSSPDRTIREKVFTSWETSWGQVADNCALALNSIAGFRLNVYQQRGWDDFLYEPLEYNRMTRQTIEAMWTAINKNKEPLVKFLSRKKKLLGIDKMSWHDYTAPIGASSRTFSLEKGANFVVEHISNFSPTMGKLVTRAFNENWVESENRDNKRAGAFCSSS
ncbi:MAG: oligoendopeptidase, partial [Firmicutes bacterium]|nr:oligoendopeptidase [Bacillota bacterium]